MRRPRAADGRGRRPATNGRSQHQGCALTRLRLERLSGRLLLIDVRFQEPGQLVEVAAGFNEPHFGNQRLGVDQFLEGNIV